MLDFIVANRIYRIGTVNEWRLPYQKENRTAAGIALHKVNFSNERKEKDPVCGDCPYGALIAKIGGGTVDTKGHIFPVGRYCVFKTSEEKTEGPLYLGVNDNLDLMAEVIGPLVVEIDIAL